MRLEKGSGGVTEPGCGTVSILSLSKLPAILHKNYKAQRKAVLICVWPASVLCRMPSTVTQVRRVNVHMRLGESMFLGLFPRFAHLQV